MRKTNKVYKKFSKKHRRRLNKTKKGGVRGDNAGQRPPRTSNRSIRSDRNASRRQQRTPQSSKNPPTPRKIRSSPIPLMSIRELNNRLKTPESSSNRRWADYSHNESLPHLPKSWTKKDKINKSATHDLKQLLGIYFS